MQLFAFFRKISVAKVWKGGSQPPLLLAVHGKKTKDYVELPHIWNFGELGWRLGIQSKLIRSMGILHWNGPKKPWTGDGLYKVLVKKIAIILAYFANVLIFPTFRN